MTASPTRYPGKGLGLPEYGPSSVAPMGPKVGAFLFDLLMSGGVALLFTRPELPQYWSLLVWAVMTTLSVGTFGFTPGQAIVGLRVARVDAKVFVGLWAVPRTALIFLVLPVVFQDADGRGVHDRVCRTVVIRTRGGPARAGS